eukprot:6105235-Pyramimonas_sp.AAC.1
MKKVSDYTGTQTVTGARKMTKRRCKGWAKVCENMQSEDASYDFEEKLRAHGGPVGRQGRQREDQ